MKGCLSEDIGDDISNARGDYGKMWQRLDEKYGNIDKLFDSILNDVKKLSRSSNTTDDVIKMINTVEKAKRDLERLGHEEELCNRTTLSVIEESMTQETMNEWVKLV